MFLKNHPNRTNLKQLRTTISKATTNKKKDKHQIPTTYKTNLLDQEED